MQGKRYRAATAAAVEGDECDLTKGVVVWREMLERVTRCDHEGLNGERKVSHDVRSPSDAGAVWCGGGCVSQDVLAFSEGEEISQRHLLARTTIRGLEIGQGGQQGHRG